jgi:hypothetical protein
MPFGAHLALPEDDAPEFWGERPGFDAADLYDAPWRAAQYPLGALGTAFKWTFGLAQRPVETGLAYLAQEAQDEPGRREYLESGGREFEAGDILGSVFDPERAATGRDVVGAYAPGLLAQHKRTQEDPNASTFQRWTTPANVLGLGVDLGTDLATYMGGGLMKLGRLKQARLADAAADLRQAALDRAHQAGRAGPVMPTVERYRRFLNRPTKDLPSGIDIPKAIPENWKGTASTLEERLRAGDTGLRLEIPFTSIGTDLPGISKNVLAPLASVTATPLGKMMSGIARSKFGQKAGEWTSLFRERPIDTAQGLAEHTARIEGRLATAELEEVMRLPEMQKSLMELAEKTGKSPEEVTRIVSEWQEAALRWDFDAGTAVYRTDAERLPFQKKLYEKVKKEVQEFTVDDKKALWETLEGQIDEARKGLIAVDKQYGLGINQLGHTFHKSLTKLDENIEKITKEATEIQTKIDDVGKSLAHDDVARITAKERLSADLAEKQEIIRQLRIDRKAVEESLLATPIWIPRQAGADVAMSKAASGSSGRASTLSVARETYKDVMGARWGWREVNGKLEVGIMPDDMSKVLRNRILQGQEKVSRLESTVAELEKVAKREAAAPKPKVFGSARDRARAAKAEIKKLKQELRSPKTTAKRKAAIQEKIATARAVVEEELGRGRVTARAGGAGELRTPGQPPAAKATGEAISPTPESFGKVQNKRLLSEAQRKLGRYQEDLTAARRELSGAQDEMRKLEVTAGKEGRGLADDWHSLEDVPVMRSLMEEHIQKQGTVSTAFRPPKRTPGTIEAGIKGFKKAVEGVKGEASEAFEQGAKMRPAAAAKEAEEATAFLKEDIVQAFAGKLRRTQNDVTQKMVEESIIAQAKGISSDTWNQVRKKALTMGSKSADDVWKDIERTFAQAEGFGIDEVLKPGYRKMNPADAIGTGPAGYVPTKGSSFHDWKYYNGYVPEDWMRRYSSYRQGAGQDLINVARSALAPFSALNSYWKKWQLTPWADYHLRNGLTDLMRMGQEGVLDARTVADFDLMLRKVLPEVTRNGWGNLDKYTDMIPGLNITLGEGLRRARAQGLLNTGQLWRTVWDAADDAASKPNWLTKNLGISKAKEAIFGKKDVVKELGKAKGVIPGGVRALAFREDMMRASAFFKGLRSGVSDINAANKAQIALFDYSNLSPFVDFARQTGLAPFLSFSSKNIPAQLRLLVEKPGQFAAMMHIYEMIEDGEAPPPSVLPRWAQDKFGVQIRVRNDQHGRPQYEYIMASGVIPQADLVDVSKNLRDYGAEQLGPMLKMAAEWIGEGDRPPEEQRSFAEIAGREMLGKPGQFARALAGDPLAEERDYLSATGRPKPEFGVVSEAGRAVGVEGEVVDKVSEIFRRFVNPMELRTIDAMNNLEKTERRLKWRLNKSKGTLNRALKAYNAARSAVARGWATEDDITPYTQKFEEAQAAYEKLRAEIDAEIRLLRKQRARVGQHLRAP